MGATTMVSNIALVLWFSWTMSLVFLKYAVPCNGCDVNSILDDCDVLHVMPMLPTSVPSMISLKTVLSLFLFMFVTSKFMSVIIVTAVVWQYSWWLWGCCRLGAGGGGRRVCWQQRMVMMVGQCGLKQCRCGCVAKRTNNKPTGGQTILYLSKLLLGR